MRQLNAIADFGFITNKSFLGRAHPITIPSRFYQALKENGLVDCVPAVISFADSLPIEGSIRIGWRTGGKYYQITMKVPENHAITHFKQGVTLHIRLFKQAENWCIELQ